LSVSHTHTQTLADAATQLQRQQKPKTLLDARLDPKLQRGL